MTNSKGAAKKTGAAKKASSESTRRASAVKKSASAAKKSAGKRQSSNESRFFSLAEVSKHFKMPEVEIGVHVNARHSQSISDALKGVIAATVTRKADSHRKAKSHAQ